MKTKILVPIAGILLATLLPAFGQPVIITDPQSRTNVLGTDAAFTVVATGTEPLAYQWQFSTADLAGKTNDTLIVTNVQSANAGDYTVVVSDMNGAITSVVATLTVLSPARIITQPANLTASLFADATFRVTAAGVEPPSYQWRFNDGDLTGKTNRTLTITNVQRTNVGNYSVVVTNDSGSVTSRLATLTITPFNAIYCFGFSWTDTRGIGCNWPSPQYYGGRACNGPMWPEFLSTNLGLVYVAANNYAHCGAEPLDILGQVTSFPAPAKPQLSAYFLWLGDSWDVTNALFTADISNTSNAVNRLYAKGARQIVIETHPDDLSKFPGYVGLFHTNTVLLAKYSEYTAGLNAAFINTMNTYSQTKPDLRIVFVDFFQKLNDVLANPAQYGFTQTIIDALHDPLLTNKSFTGPGADYVFWDDLHGTSKLNQLIAAWHLEALTHSILETLDVTISNGSPNIQMKHLLIGRDYTLQGSTNLSNWQDIQAFTAAAGTNRWTGAAAAVPAAFYRLKWQP